jgi:hypothetical protein
MMERPLNRHGFAARNILSAVARESARIAKPA